MNMRLSDYSKERLAYYLAARGGFLATLRIEANSRALSATVVTAQLTIDSYDDHIELELTYQGSRHSADIARREPGELVRHTLNWITESLKDQGQENRGHAA